jgi:hypothetical protein
MRGITTQSSLWAKPMGRGTRRSLVEGPRAPMSPPPRFARSPSPSLRDGEDWL